jgi:hypothetical protein
MPAAVVKIRDVALSTIRGGGILIVTFTVAGLPTTVLPVRGSIALTITFVVTDVPPTNPVVSTTTLRDAVVPPAKFVPEAVERET